MCVFFPQKSHFHCKAPSEKANKIIMNLTKNLGLPSPKIINQGLFRIATLTIQNVFQKDGHKVTQLWSMTFFRGGVI